MASDSPVQAYLHSIAFVHVVPAAPGYVVLSLTPLDDGTQSLRHNPVVAWGIPTPTATGAGWLEGALPICMAALDQNDLPAVLCPDGCVRQGDLWQWASADEWRRAQEMGQPRA